MNSTSTAPRVPMWVQPTAMIGSVVFLLGLLALALSRDWQVFIAVMLFAGYTLELIVMLHAAIRAPHIFFEETGEHVTWATRVGAIGLAPIVAGALSVAGMFMLLRKETPSQPS